MDARGGGLATSMGGGTSLFAVAGGVRWHGLWGPSWPRPRVESAGQPAGTTSPVEEFVHFFCIYIHILVILAVLDCLL